MHKILLCIFFWWITIFLFSAFCTIKIVGVCLGWGVNCNSCSFFTNKTKYLTYHKNLDRVIIDIKGVADRRSTQVNIDTQKVTYLWRGGHFFCMIYC